MNGLSEIVLVYDLFLFHFLFLFFFLLCLLVTNLRYRNKVENSNLCVCMI